MKKKHIGSNFDDFLREEHLLDVAEAVAAKRVIAFQIAQEMKRSKLTKSEMASRMRTSRAALQAAAEPSANWRLKMPGHGDAVPPDRAWCQAGLGPPP